MQQGFESDIVRIEKMCDQYSRFSELLTYEEVILDKKLFLSIKKQSDLLSPMINLFEEYKKIKNDIQDLEVIVSESNLDEREILLQELNVSIRRLDNIKNELSNKLIVFDNVVSNVIIEIVSDNNEESNKLKNILNEAYYNFCQKNALNYLVKDDKFLHVSGIGAYEFFQKEIGMHKLTNSNNYGICQVFVYKDINFIDTNITDNDIEIIAYRSSGAGGQHINTTDSAIKVTHIETGISAICQDQRSQFQNKEKAIERLKNKLIDYNNKINKDTLLKQKREQLKYIKNNSYVKVYDIKSDRIKSSSNEELKLENFLKGNTL